jgi:hypothetical protein
MKIGDKYHDLIYSALNSTYRKTLDDIYQMPYSGGKIEEAM